MSDVETRLGLPIRAFDDQGAFDRWLAAEPRTSPGFWMKIGKKGTDGAGISKAGAIDVALCHGWIDGQQHPYDDLYWLTKFTPRRANSRWSQVNRTRVGELTAEGRMRPAGLAEVRAAREDGRWDAAYAPASTAEPPTDLLAALDASPQAAAAFAIMNRGARYSILYRLHNLKTAQGRANSISRIIAKLSEGQRG